MKEPKLELLPVPELPKELQELYERVSKAMKPQNIDFSKWSQERNSAAELEAMRFRGIK